MRLVIVLLVSAVVSAQSLKFDLVRRDVVLARLDSVPAKDIDREHQLQTYFEQAGCRGENLILEEAKHGPFANVVCTLAGASPQQIVVGAHFDHVDAGSGAVDNWSGASLLPSLYQALAAEPRKHTFVFVAFYGEERGMLGSQYYVHELDKAALSHIDAMVNMDTLGLGPTKVWASHADPELVERAAIVALSMKLPLSAVNVERIGSTDSESFRDKKVPSITFHSLTQSTLHILHSRQDQLSEIKQDDYFDSYRLLAGYLSYLDETVKSR
jgi:acetylornithine deacetylase/succinyl-diaminopimelate desuccinylase-like protein